MTAHRRPAIAHSDAPRGTCRWCGEAIVHESGDKRGQPNRRRRWHEACVRVYNESDPREARRLVRKRDRGRCAACGLDTYALRRELRRKGRAGRRELAELGFKPGRSLWELDHITPLIDGGGHEASNLQTLCTPCHVTKTAREARERAACREAAVPRAPGPSAPAQAVADAEAPATGEPAARERRVGRAARASLEELLEAADAANARAEAALARFGASS